MKNIIFFTVLVFMMQGCSLKQKKPDTKEALIKNLYSRVGTLEKKIQSSEDENSFKLNQLKDEILYHEKVLTALIQDISDIKESKRALIEESTEDSEESPDDDTSTTMTKDDIVKFEPSTFKLTEDSDILDEYGKVYDVWQRGRSFTSYIKKGDYYKITGYFKGGAWTKADTDMWIAIENVQKRF